MSNNERPFDAGTYRVLIFLECLLALCLDAEFIVPRLMHLQGLHVPKRFSLPYTFWYKVVRLVR